MITLSVNGLNTLMKTQVTPDWIKKQDPIIFCLQEIHLKYKDTDNVTNKGWEKISLLMLINIWLY